MATPRTLEQILGYVYLTGLVKAIKTGIPDVLPSKFMSIKKDTIMDQGRYTRITGTRKVARRAEYGAPSINRELRDIGSFDVKLIHSIESIVLDVKLYQSLRAYDNYNVQNMGVQEITRQASEFRAYFDNHRMAALYSALGQGSISYDSNGNLLPTTSGSTVSVSYGLAASHINQIGGDISTSWLNPAADIPLHIRRIKFRSIKDTGYVQKYAFYGIDIPSYLAVNAQVQPYLARSPVMREKFLDTGEVPDGLFDLTWVPVYTAFYDDQAGTHQTLFGTDAITSTPEIDSVWYEWMNGTYPVPSSFQPQASLQSTVGAFSIETGMFAYGVPVSDPCTAKFVSGDTFLPIIKFPDAYFIWTVLF